MVLAKVKWLEQVALSLVDCAQGVQRLAPVAKLNYST